MAADQDDDPTPGLTARWNRGDLGGGPRDLPAGGYQRPAVEGSRAYEPGEKGRGDTPPEGALPEGSADEVAAPFDEDAILDRVDRERHGNAAAAATGDLPDRSSRTFPTGAGLDRSTTFDTGATSAPSGTGASAGGDPLLGAEEVRGKRRALAPVDKSRSDYG